MGVAFEQSIPGGDVSIPAAADLSAKQHYCVKVNSSGQVALCDAAGEIAHGVLQNKPDAQAKAASVRTLGVTKVVAAAAIEEGAVVTPTAAGKVTTGYGADRVLGIALEPAAADGDVIPVMLTPMGGFAQHAPHTVTFHATASALTAADFAKWTPGYAGRIKSFDATCKTAVTTGSKGADANLEIGTTNVTGGAIDLDGTHAAGDSIAGTAISAANVFDDDDVITLEITDVTTFSEGEFEFVIQMG